MSWSIMNFIFVTLLCCSLVPSWRENYIEPLADDEEAVNALEVRVSEPEMLDNAIFVMFEK